jgi:hypothetical protein
MSTLNNYIPGTNPFKLAGPPDYWLKALWHFDSSLVVVPSKQGFYYRLAQRRKPQLTTKIVNDILFKDSDSQMLASYNLVPVTTILATATWSNYGVHFEELRRRASWRNGGANAVIDKIEQSEAADEAAKQAKTDEHLTYLGKDAWKYYKKKIGLRGIISAP